MRNQALFTTIELDAFVPASHPLRPIHQWVNDALANMDAKLSAMYEAGVKGARPIVVPEKLMRAMLLQVLYSIRSECQLVGSCPTTCCSASSSVRPSKIRCGTSRCSAITATGLSSITA